jgi:dCMP deaminase
MNIKELPYLMDIAELTAKRSHALRLKVGAVAADENGRYIASGYNGTHAGADNTCERRIYLSDEKPEDIIYHPEEYPYYDVDMRDHYRLETLDSVIHAEQNVITYAAKRGLSLDGAAVIGTHSPCLKCATLMIQAGVKEMFFANKHRSYDNVCDEVGQYIRLTQYTN